MALSKVVSPKRIYPSNPLGIIALFVFFIEAIGTSCLIVLDEPHDAHLRLIMVLFIAIFPMMIAGFFFLIMWKKPAHLFSPQDVGDSAVWLEGIKVQLSEIKKEQALFHVSEHPPKNLDDVMALVDDLLQNREYKNIIRIGRGYLKIKEYDKCLRLFRYVLKKTPKTEEFYYTFQANCAYSLIGLKEYKQAVQFLSKIEDRLGDKTAVWHLAAFAYCYKMLNDNEKFDKYYHAAVGCPNFNHEKIVFQRVYPEVNWEYTLLSANGLN